MKIQEIAKKADVSTATVSRVFGHHPNISREVREKVLAVARAEHWRPRCSRRQRNIVIITPGHSHYPIHSYVEMVISELSLELAKREYRIERLPAENLDRLPMLSFCGAVAIGLDEKVFPEWDHVFEAPLILVDSRISGEKRNIFSVASDEVQGMNLAIQNLVRNGCRKIGSIVYGHAGTGNVDIRVNAIRSALRKNHLPVERGLIRTAWTADYVEYIGTMLKAGIDALFCPGGNAGIVAAYALSLYNRRIPEDISLIASERTDYSCYTVPPQTTISQDYTFLANTIADQLDHALDGDPLESSILIPYHLIERSSVRLPL